MKERRSYLLMLFVLGWVTVHLSSSTVSAATKTSLEEAIALSAQRPAAAVKTIGSHVTGIQADVSKAADLDRVVEVIEKEKGRIDTVFANAGGGTFLPLGAITEQQYHDTFDTNVKGVILTVQKALPLLPNGATIVLNADAALGMGIFNQHPGDQRRGIEERYDSRIQRPGRHRRPLESHRVEARDDRLHDGE